MAMVLTVATPHGPCVSAVCIAILVAAVDVDLAQDFPFQICLSFCNFLV